MASSFSLIQQLQNQEDNVDSEYKKIKYRQYDIMVEGNECGINIPIRQSAAFEAAILNCEQPITQRSFKSLLRKFYGTRVIQE